MREGGKEAFCSLLEAFLGKLLEAKKKPLLLRRRTGVTPESALAYVDH